MPNGLKVTRNSTGHIIKVDGSDWKVFQWLSAAHINTTYTIYLIKLIIHFKKNIICFVDLIIRFDIIFINPLTNPLDKSGDKLGILDLVGKGVS